MSRAGWALLRTPGGSGGGSTGTSQSQSAQNRMQPERNTAGWIVAFIAFTSCRGAHSGVGTAAHPIEVAPSGAAR